MKKYIREYLMFTDIMIMNAIFLLALICTIPHLTSGMVWLFLLIGMVTYALSEYLVHRFLFHLKPPKNPTLLRFLKRLHYDHHVYPDELELLFLPVWYSLPLIGSSVLVVYLLTASLPLTAAFSTGVVGYLLFYEWTHYIAHRPVQPFTPWGRWMKKIHLWHHYKNENFWYGVTTPVFDVALGTWRGEKDVVKSKTARDLEKMT